MFVTFGAICSAALHAWVKWTYQPIERCIVDQVVHDIIHRISYSAQLRSTDDEYCTGHVFYGGRLSEAAIYLHGRLGDRGDLDLDVLRETFEAGHQDQICGLKLLAEVVGNGQCTRFYFLFEKKNLQKRK